MWHISVWIYWKLRDTITNPNRLRVPNDKWNMFLCSRSINNKWFIKPLENENIWLSIRLLLLSGCQVCKLPWFSGSFPRTTLSLKFLHWWTSTIYTSRIFQHETCYCKKYDLENIQSSKMSLEYFIQLRFL